MKKIILFPYRALVGVMIALAVSFELFLINLMQVLSSVIYPINRELFYNVNRYIPRMFWFGCMAIAEKIHGRKVEFFYDPLPAQENALIISNHQSAADVIGLSGLAIREGMELNLKFMVKDALKWVPGLGLGLLYIRSIRLKRNWAKDQKTIQAAFQPFLKEKYPMWLTIFVEGTRINDRKLAVAQRYARQKNLYIPQRTLIPRAKGMLATLKGLDPLLTAVYDMTVYYTPLPHRKRITLLDFTFARGTDMQVHVKRYPLAEVPRTEKELSAWLLERYREKDQLILRLEEEDKKRSSC